MGLKPLPSSRQVVLRAGPWPLSEILEFFCFVVLYLCALVCFLACVWRVGVVIFFPAWVPGLIR